MNQTSITLTNCDREPIHIPRAIQAFGALLVLDAKTHEILQVSANVQSIFEFSPDQLLKKSFKDVFATDLDQALSSGEPWLRGTNWIANITRSENLILIEGEKRGVESPLRPERAALDQLTAAQTLEQLLNRTVQAIGQLTALDRVMVYRFHTDLHGEVVAEFTRPGVDSYLGLHYPATDIPVPARAIFLKNWVRMIPDVHYTPVPLMPVLNPHTHQPLDLGNCLLRAVSPVHIEYLKNMEVGASLTVSLIVDGKLWGLIACHALKPLYIPLELRSACESIGRLTSAYISVKDDFETQNQRSKFRGIHQKLVKSLKNAPDMAKALTDETPNLVDLIHAHGSAAALYLDGYWATTGESPTPAQLEKLVDWLVTEQAGKTFFVTDSLSEHFALAKEFGPSACGLLAVAVPKSARNFMFWFRPEQVSTVNWAGDPQKQPDEMGRLSPRGSFQEWAQEVKGKSMPWTSLEVEAAIELRNSVMAVDLQRQFIKEQEARADAERAMRSREELMAVLSHDLKNPIGSIKLGAKVAARFLKPEAIENVRTYLTRIDRAASNMDNLINDILSITKLEAGHLDVEKKAENLSEIILEVCDILSPLAQEKGIRMACALTLERCDAQCDRGQMIQVISNLLGNAIKFSPEHSVITVDIENCGPEFTKISIRDEGPGINPEHLKLIFDRFWQAQQTRRLGTGLGLAIAKGIVEAHGGEVWAESDGKKGTIFYLTVPVVHLLQA